MSGRRLRVQRHRGTTAHLASAYPFLAEAGLGHRGVYLGTNLLTGGAGFAYDPFEAYTQGLVTNPNVLVAGEPGTGKSSFVKTFIARALAIFNPPQDSTADAPRGRWVAIVDPKGEYTPLAEALDLSVVRVYPGGPTRINPLDPGPLGNPEQHDELVRRRGDLVAALLGQVLHRDLEPLEDAALGWAIHTLDTTDASQAPTLDDLVRLLRTPTAPITDRVRLDGPALAQRLDAVVFALEKLLDRSLRGMFDGPTNVDLDWHRRGLVAVSRRPGFSKRALAEALGKAGIEYRHEPELGNPVENRDAFRSTATIQQGRRRMRRRLDNGSRLALEELVASAQNARVAVLAWSEQLMRATGP